MRKRLGIELVCVALVIGVASIGICAEPAQSKQVPNKMSMLEKAKKAFDDFKNKNKKAGVVKASPAPQPKPVKAEMTKEEMIAGIKKNLETANEIISAAPGLKSEKDNEGKVFYTYNDLKLEDTGKEDLQRLFTRVSQAAVKYRTERIEKQLQSVRQAQQATKTAAGAGKTTGPAAPPTMPGALKTPTPGRAPAIPSSLATPPSAVARTPSASVANPPSTPSAPPAPPSSRR